MSTTITPEVRAQLGVLDVDMAAALLGCSADTVRDEVAAGRIPHVRLGRSPVFPIGALLEHLNERAKNAPGPAEVVGISVNEPAPAPAAPRARRAPPKLPPSLS